MTLKIPVIERSKQLCISDFHTIFMKFYTNNIYDNIQEGNTSIWDKLLSHQNEIN